MSNINELRNMYGNVINAHTDIIQKKATNFEESLIYKNDIETILNGKFVKILDSFFNGRNKVSSLKVKFSESRYSNIFDSIQDFCKVSYGYYLAIDNLNTNIKNCSMEAYKLYCTEFDDVDKKWNEIKEYANSHFSKYDDCNKTLERKKGSLHRAKMEANQTEIESLNSEIKSLEFDLEAAINTIKSDIRALLTYNSDLIILLDEALRKTTV